MDIEQSRPNPLMFQALEYAKLGWKALPLHSIENRSCTCGSSSCPSPGKHPRVRHGSKDASSDPFTVCQWWSQWPNANIGIATGSVSNLLVVDVDLRHGGEESWRSFFQQNQLGHTLTALTGGGGFHLYYKLDGKQLGNKTNVLPGVDIRGEGGYVVAPPSLHASGEIYDWKEGLEPELVTTIPDEIISLIRSSRSFNVILLQGKQIPNGSRNNTLTSVAGVLRRHGLEEAGILDALSAMNKRLCYPPLEVKEVATIAKSISKYQNPDQSEALEWSEPTELPDVSTSVPCMTASYLPGSLKPWLLDITDRMQIPIDFVAAPVLVAMSSVMGRQVGIYPKQKDDWLVVPNI